VQVVQVQLSEGYCSSGTVQCCLPPAQLGVSCTSADLFCAVLHCTLHCCGHVCLQASNIATTVRTIIIGLVYLATFIFSANALGLTGENLCINTMCRAATAVLLKHQQALLTK
jgi:hypothetical protein